MAKKIILILICSIFVAQIVQSVRVKTLGNHMEQDDSDEDDDDKGHKNRCDKCPGDKCVELDNCVNYQVNLDYTNYGCAACEKSYMLDADLRGAGTCTKKNKIENCVWASNEADVNNGKPFCWACKRNYLLSNDRTCCTALPKCDRKIENCREYWVNDDGKKVCNKCEDTFILSEDQLTCDGECTISGCKSCISIKGDNYCWNCEKGLIGVYSNAANFFTECLDCKTWKGRLLSSKIGCDDDSKSKKDKEDKDD
jgi:hypothetical protein